MNRPAYLAQEPYALPAQYGSSPRGRDPGSEANGGYITGAPWNADFRGETFVADTYQGFGSTVQYGLNSGRQPTGWDPHTGLVDSVALIPGYGGSLQDLGMPVDLRAGSTIMFPTSGQMEPGFDPTLIELTNEPGVDVGWQLYGGEVTRRMLFQEPPGYGEQTDPIPAAGYP